MLWNQTYEGSEGGTAHSLVETSDGGYALVGDIYSLKGDVSDRDFWLVKTDEYGKMEWNQTYEGIWEEHASSLVQTGDGGYAIAGYTYSFGAGNTDFWLIKTDEMGKAEWNQTYGGTMSEGASSLIETSDGGYALAGYMLAPNWGDPDFWLVKTDSYGNMEWNKTYGGPESESAYSLVETSDGGYALAGETFGYIRVGENDSLWFIGDFWLVKTDEYGNMEWNRTYGGPEPDWATALIATSDGGFAIAGETDSFGAGGGDFWLVKTDAAGNVEWNHTYGGERDDMAKSLVETTDGGYALAGFTNPFPGL